MTAQVNSPNTIDLGKPAHLKTITCIFVENDSGNNIVNSEVRFTPNLFV